MSAGKKAFFEWIPIRENFSDSIIYRNFMFGSLINFIFLDTRLVGRNYARGLDNADTNKTMLGKQQFEWFTNQLYNSQNTDTTVWKIVAQQVMFALLLINKKAINPDQWDGYQHEREQVLEFILKNNIKNVVILTGDIHTSWANEIYLDKTKKRKKRDFENIIPEFITPSVTSPSLGKITAFFGKIFIKSFFRHVNFVQLSKRGFVLLNVNKDFVKADWYFVSTIKKRDFTVKHAHTEIVSASGN